MLRYLTGLNDQDLATEIERLQSPEKSKASVLQFKTGVLLNIEVEESETLKNFENNLGSRFVVDKYRYQNDSRRWLLHLPHPAPDDLANFPIPTHFEQSDNPIQVAFCRLVKNLQIKNWQYYAGKQMIPLDRPMIMGILNITPDSFSDGGRYLDPQKAITHALQLAESGADIIDIGGESSRPGADPVSEAEEWQRIGPVIEKLVNRENLLLSVDTYKASVARKALKAGAHIINDISGMMLDNNMIEVVAEFNAPVVLMHMQNSPKTMQDSPHYHHLMDEVWQALQNRVQMAQDKGVQQIILDPGIGFGKRLADNYELIRRLGEFRAMGFPLLIGASRKAFLRESLGTGTEHSLSGSVTASLISIMNGAQIVRVHDVVEMRQALQILSEINLRKAS